MPVRVHIVSGPEFRNAAAALRAVDTQLPTQLRTRMRQAIQPAVARAKEKVRSLPVSGQAGTTGLRRRVAAGTRIQASTGRNARLRVITSMADPDEAVIPRGLDSAAGWRHPVFGNQDVWVTQRPQRTGWFTETLADGRDEVQRGLEDALEWAAEFVDRST